MQFKEGVRQIAPALIASLALGGVGAKAVELTRGQTVPSRGPAQIRIYDTTTELPTPPIELSPSPTVDQIRDHLPETLNPQFIFMEDEKREQRVPSFVVLGPLVFNRVVGEKFDPYAEFREAADGQKYLEFSPLGEDMQKPGYVKIRVAFTGLMADELEPLLGFKETHLVGSKYMVIVPVDPPKEWKDGVIEVYMKRRGLNEEQAEELYTQMLKTSTDSITQYSEYMVTLDPSFVRPI